MPPLTVLSNCEPDDDWLTSIEAIAASPAVSRILLIGDQVSTASTETRLSPPARKKVAFVQTNMFSGKGVMQLLDLAATDYLMLIAPGQRIRFNTRSGAGSAIERMLAVAIESGAGLVYSDFTDELDGRLVEHPLIDYQLGSLRDDFDFGSVITISKRAACEALRRYGQIDDGLRWAGFYDLRLKLSIDSIILRIPEPLYSRATISVTHRASGERQFDYLDERQRAYQLEMEAVATAHLKRIGAYLAPVFQPLPPPQEYYPLCASVVIPVRNRERTIRDAITSALAQQASFDFNIIVVDNHSSDRTGAIVAEIARNQRRVVHIIPEHTDHGIGGCWNEAIYSPYCGQYAVQLDSDDIYKDEHTLERIIAKFSEGQYAMVIGSYTVVNFDLQEIPPGLVDHREWTRENGRNNALRINGLGAPRAFYVPVLRQFGFPDVSYGEDYAVGLRISRHYEIGRIYQSLYFVRRWEGNSDARLDLETANRYQAYKDKLRTIEILARKRMNES
jgi:hypothetical protein